MGDEDTKTLRQEKSVQGKSNCVTEHHDYTKRAPELTREIKNSLPREAQAWDRALFSLCRRLRARHDLADLHVRELKPAVELWYQLCPHGMPTLEIVWEQFQRVYLLVKVPFGSEDGLLYRVREEAENMLLPPQLAYYTDTQRRLVQACLALDRLTGGKDFYLSCRFAGQVLGISHQRAAGLLAILVSDGLLEVTDPGSQSEPRRYQYIGP